MLNRTAIILFFILLIQSCTVQKPNDFIDPLNRYSEFQFKDQVSDHSLSQIIETFDNHTGKWSNIDYADQSRTGWKVLPHLRNILMLSQAISIDSSTSASEEKMLAIINKGLEFWIESNFVNDNWFPNEITIPGIYRGILISMRGKGLDSELREKMIVRLSESDFSKKSGVNRIWLADIRLHYGLLINDATIVREAVDAIEHEISIQNSSVGLQEDYSYHFHDHRLQMYSYGRGFLVTTSRLAWELKDTQFAFSPEKVDLLCDFVLEGWQWMARGPYTVPSTMDRASSRKGALRSPRQLQTIDFLIETHPARKRELLIVREAQHNIKNFKLTGLKNFYKSDLVVAHTPQASLFIKTLSNRNLPTQSINSENLQGRFLNAGNTYFMKNGLEYFNMQGSWDWNLLPGFSYVQGASRIKRHAFTGAIHHSNYSVSVMKYELLDSKKESVYSARKTWFVLDDQIMVALISPSNGGREVLTAMDQSKWIGEIEGNFQKDKITQRGSYNTKQPFWLYHNGWGYMSHSPQLQMNLTLEAENSDWQGINARYSNQKEIEEQIFKPVLITHGEAVTYAVAPAKSAFEVKKLFENSTWTVNHNSKDAQVITLKNGVIMAAIYKENFKVKLSEYTEIVADQPILLIIEADIIKVTNLNPKQSKVKLTVNANSMELELATIEGTVVSVPK
jgi:chondroitin AC lyase